MNEKFTQDLFAFIETPIEQRNNAQGALLLLQVSRNQIMYRNISVNPDKYAKFIDRELRKYYNARLVSVTHEEVTAMQQQVDKIVENHLKYFDENNPAKSFKKGIREDHDSLPDEIRALYTENLSITQRMREVHLQLRNMSAEGSTCPDSDRFPFLKELIELDKKMHSNWEIYDHYVVGQPVAMSATSPDDLKIIRQINLNKGKYAKSPTEKLKERILSLYDALTVKPDNITSALSNLGIL